MIDRTIDVDDIAVGDEGPELVVENVERRDFVEYAGASGDFNPIHYDEEYARSTGNPSVFGQGMYVAGVLSSMVCRWFGRDSLRSFSTRFENRVWPGDTLVASGEIVDVDREDGTVEADLQVETEDGDTIVTGTVVSSFG